MARLRIIIDTREQTPWSFDPGSVVAEIGTLKSGIMRLRAIRLRNRTKKFERLFKHFAEASLIRSLKLLLAHL